jgi:hypothetical protein
MKPKTNLAWLAVIVGVLLFVLLHECIYEGNHSKLLFPALQTASAFQVITEIPYSGERVLYFEYGTDRDADSWYYLAAEVDEATLHRIIEKKSLTKLPFQKKTFQSWRFQTLAKPRNPDYYSVVFSRKGRIHLWYDRATRMLYLVDEWIA